MLDLAKAYTKEIMDLHCSLTSCKRTSKVVANSLLMSSVSFHVKIKLLRSKLLELANVSSQVARAIGKADSLLSFGFINFALFGDYRQLWKPASLFMHLEA